MQGKTKEFASNLTDDDVLKEFVRRFQCDAAVLIYLDSGSEYAFGRWNNGTGKGWVNSVFHTVKSNVVLKEDKHLTSEGLTTKL